MNATAERIDLSTALGSSAICKTHRQEAKETHDDYFSNRRQHTPRPVFRKAGFLSIFVSERGLKGGFLIFATFPCRSLISPCLPRWRAARLTNMR